MLFYIFSVTFVMGVRFIWSENFIIMMKSMLLVGLGGGIGSVLRYGLSLWIGKYYQGIFPVATFAVNISGSFIIGLLIGLLDIHPADSGLKYLFMIGFCGGFTTFSAFAAENLSLLHSGNSITAMVYMVACIAASILAVWSGIVLVR